MQLSHMLYGTTYSTRLDAQFDDLSELKIFPVWTGRPRAHFDSLRSASVTDNNTWWYIADFRHLSDAFEGRVPLLAVEPHMLDGIKDLISSMRWQNRTLHKIATMNVSAEGSDQVHAEYTRSLQSKWRCLARYLYIPTSSPYFFAEILITPRLVPVSKPDRAEVIKQLRSVQVVETEGVSVAWQFENNLGNIITGQTQKGRVMIAANGSTLRISLIKDDMKIGCPPLELTEELSKFCGIARSRYVRLLGHVLTQSDTGRINTDLDRWDVPELGPDFDDVEIDTQPADPNIQATSGEPTTASPPPKPPTRARSGRQKLRAGWQQSLYGNNAPHQKNIGSSKDGDTAWLEVNQARRLKDGAGGDKAFETNKSKRKAGKAQVRDEEGTPVNTSEALSRQEKARYLRKKKALKEGQASEVDSGLGDSPSSSTLPIPSSLPSQIRAQSVGAGRVKQRIGRKGGNQGLISLSMPVTSTSKYSQVEESQFIAELYVSLQGCYLASFFLFQLHMSKYLLD